MYTFHIMNKKGAWETYRNIEKVCYALPESNVQKSSVELENDNIFTHKYKSYHDLYLYSQNEAYFISKRNISIIKITKEVS